MLLIQCTKKLANELKMRSMDKASNDSFYSWHAHLFFFNHKKYALILNNKTRYNFVVGSLRKAEFMRFGDFVKEKLEENLLAEEMDKDLVEKYVQACDSVSYSPTSERSIISQINEMIMFAEMKMDQSQSSEMEINLVEVNQFLNRIVMLKLPETYSITSMDKALQEIRD